MNTLFIRLAHCKCRALWNGRRVCCLSFICLASYLEN